ncbi:type IX secretion system membrane protein PorP/SprF [Marinilabiliaceae bacterium JC017]|nr:type IX secretion system membrane protein PorP/SprF [Marinilabiliaceae bacterium JC017]
MRKSLSVILSVCALILVVSTRMNGQDVSFSQMYASPLYLSPSFTGLTNGTRLALNYRDQWPGIPNTYSTVAFSADHFFEDYSSGVGVLFLRDNQGSGQLVRQDIGVSYAYEIEVVRDIFVRPGILFKYAEQKIDPSRIELPDQIGPDGNLLPGAITTYVKENYNKFDAAASAMIYSDFFWFGVAVDHLIKNDIGFTDVETSDPIKTSVYAGYKYRYKESRRSSDEQSVTLAMNYRMQQDYNQLDIGTYWYINPLEVGLWYRGIPGVSTAGLVNNDALIMILGVHLGPVRFSYSYDLTMSELAGYSNGANEFSILYRFGQSSKKKSYRGAMPCSEPGVSGAYSGSRHRRHRSRKIF